MHPREALFILFASAALPVSGALAGVTISTGVAAQRSETVLYSFKNGNDGSLPFAGLIADGKGNFYGTTQTGGGSGCGGQGCGTVFRLAADGTETILYSFRGGTDGAKPQAGLIADNAGNLYGTTGAGGGSRDAGTVFELASDGMETILYTFCSLENCVDGGGPEGGLVMDSSRNLFGATAYGGILGHGGKWCSHGCGVVFRLAPDGVETVLHAFKGRDDGAAPEGSLIMAGSGDLYGTTPEGGMQSRSCREIFPARCDTVFKIAPDGKERVLYRFCSQPNCADGAAPELGTLVMDRQGNLYGTAAYGGARGHGVVFRLAPNGEETVLHDFQGAPDGLAPLGGLVGDGKGNFYGTTLQGGSGTGCAGEIGCGTVFKVARDGAETILYSFQHGGDGSFPYGGVMLDGAGSLFGTTGYGGGTNCSGGYGCGTVFEIGN